MQNIMLRSRDQEEIKLIDFGLAKKMQGGKVRSASYSYYILTNTVIMYQL
jgi:serine/threonine protein kinase